MGREGKGQKDPLEAVATLSPHAAPPRDLPPPQGWLAVPCADEVPRTDEPARDADGARSPSARWFDALDPEIAPARGAAPRWLLSIPLVVTALVLAATARGWILRELLPVALVAAAVVVLARGRRRSPPAQAQASRRGVSLEDDRLLLHVKGNVRSHVLLATRERFGVTLLATPRRDRVVALLSSSAGLSCVGASFDGASRRAFAALLDRASIVSADEVGLDAIGPDGEPIALAPATLSALLDALAQRSPGCLERFVLTDARGAALSLDGRELHAGGRVFDLSAPLEWRAFVFQEALGQAVAVYQGTWVRQGTSEVVLVCLLPAMAPALDGMGTAAAPLDHGALRDLRLMQGAPEGPPPLDQRVAVDRLLMVPIRSALDKAPRPAAQAPRARA